MRTTAGRLAIVLALSVTPTIFTSAYSAASAHPPPKGACQQVAPAGVVGNKVIDSVPWAQSTLGFDRAWRYSTGAGVRVAVIDSGVDASNPVLAQPGKVVSGFDFVHLQNDATYDCIGHGTGVASIIAGRHVDGAAFEGVAPGAQILPVLITVQPPTQDENNVPQRNDPRDDRPQTVDAAGFAAAIRYAVVQGAKVINLSVTDKVDVPAVRAAVMFAERRDVVVVAAAGNAHAKGQPGPGTTNVIDPPVYPAAYPGVLGVGALQMNGSVADESQHGSYVDITAPGDGITSAFRVHGFAQQRGTSFATPFVSGTAALVRAEFPQLTAKQVIARILATARPAPGNRPAYGVGEVDPYRAVTEPLGGANAVVAPTPAPRVTPDVAGQRKLAAARLRASHADHSVLLLGGGALGLALLALVVSMGRRRRWTPGRVDPGH